MGTQIKQTAPNHGDYTRLVLGSELYKQLCLQNSLISSSELDDLIDAFLFSDILGFLNEILPYRALKGDELDVTVKQLFIREVIKLVSL